MFMGKPGFWRDRAQYVGMFAEQDMVLTGGSAAMSLPSQSCSEDCCNLPPVFRATLLPASLWLWHACCQVCAHCCWQPETQVPRGEWECPAAPGLAWCQPGQVLGSRCPSLSGMQWFGTLAKHWDSTSQDEKNFGYLFHSLILSILWPASLLPDTLPQILSNNGNSNIPNSWFLIKIVSLIG